MRGNRQAGRHIYFIPEIQEGPPDTLNTLSSLADTKLFKLLGSRTVPEYLDIFFNLYPSLSKWCIGFQ